MNKTDLQTVKDRIAPYVHRTPVLTSRLLNEMSSINLYFKCENFQKMGAFKMRGAMNGIMSLSEAELKNGVVTHSSGNFAQAVALSAQIFGVKAYIVMPSNAPVVKKAAVKGYGGEITECGPTIKHREAAVAEIIARTGASPLHPSNQDEVILGNSTLAVEMLEDYPDLDYIIAPVGGGGLVAGIALAAHHFGNNCKTIGAEPINVDDAYRSLREGKIQYNDNNNTIADGLRTHLGDRNFPIIQKYVDHIIRVEEEEIISGMKLIWERLKIVIEPSAGVGVAAAFKNKDNFKGKKVGVVLCGGNVDLGNLPF